MKVLIEEKDETQGYRVIPLEQFKEATYVFPDRIEIYIPNLCGGETRITIFKSEIPEGHPHNVPLLKRIKKRLGR